MKRIYFLFSLMAFLNSTFACSCGSSVSFCECHDNYDLTASCVIVGSFPHGISLKILQVINGNESRDTVKVWDKGGPYNQCNDSMFDASAAFLGNVGDTLILALPKIDTLKNMWDVIGDYITPGLNCDVYKLYVSNNTVTGFISGSTYCYYLHNCVDHYNYDAFLVDFPTKSLSCQTWLTTTELSAQEFFNYYPNPASDKITITASDRGTLTILNHLGQLVEAIAITDGQTEISTDKILNGVYFLTFQTKENLIARKLVVQH